MTTTTVEPWQAGAGEPVRGRFEYVFALPAGAQIDPTAWGEALGPVGAWSLASAYSPVIELRLWRSSPRGPLRLTVAVVLHDPFGQLSDTAARQEAVELLRPITDRHPLRRLTPAQLRRYRKPIVNHVAEIADADPYLPEGGAAFSGLFSRLVAGLQAAPGHVGLSMLVGPARDDRPDRGLAPPDPLDPAEPGRQEREDRQVQFRLRVFSELALPATLLARAEAVCISRRPLLSSWRVPLDRNQLAGARQAIAAGELDLWPGASAAHGVNPRIAALTLSLAAVPRVRGTIVDGRPATGPLPTTGAVLGKVARPDGRRVPWRLCWAERRHHVLLAGASGCGKSTAIKRLVLEDVAHGRSVVIVDPHGDLANEVAAIVPASRLVHIDPRITGSAAMDLSGTDPTSITAILIAAMSEVWPPEYLGPVLFRAVTISGQALDASNRFAAAVTLVALERFMTDAPWREWVIGGIADPQLRAEAQHEHRVWSTDNPGGQGGPSLTQYVASKFVQLTQGPARALFDRPPTRPLEADLAAGSVVVVALPLGLLGAETTRFAARVFLSRLTTAIAAQGARPEHERHEIAVFLDEAGLMTGRALAGLFSGSRKFGAAMHLAVQAPSMLGRHLEEIQTNCQLQLLGRLPASQAAYLADRAGEATVRLLPTLPRHHLAVVTEDHDPLGDPLVLTPVPPPAGP